jgi:cephalosporin-C deacetylase-like acetyl esterase
LKTFSQIVSLFVCLALPGLVLAQDLAPGAIAYKPDHADGVYAKGETVGWSLVLQPGASLPEKPLEYQVYSNGAVLTKSAPLHFEGGQARIEYASDEPQTVLVKIPHAGQFPVLSDGAPAFAKTPDATLGAVISPLDIAPVLPKPADFDAFWSEKLAKQKALPIEAQETPVDQGNSSIRLAKVKVNALGSTMHAYLARPAAPGKYPAVIVYQWAGVYALPMWTAISRAGQGWLTLNVDSHDLEPDQSAGVPGDYQSQGNHDRETAYFLNMYLRDSRAIDYIKSLPDWDGHTIVIMGASMGGQQSLVTAALNPESVSAVLVNEPAGADFNAAHYGRKQGYPNWPSDDKKAMEVGAYFDTINFADRIKAPLLMAIGYIDGTCPPSGLWSVFHQVTGAKEAFPMVESDHGFITPDKTRAFEARQEVVLEALRRGMGFVPNPALIDQPGN